MKDDDVLLHLDESGGIAFTVEESFRSIAFTGRMGAGKTLYGICAMFVAMCLKGFGFLCACPKPNSASQFLNWARRAGRGRDVIIVNPDGQNLFDILTWLSTRYKGEAMVTEAVLLLEELGELLGRGRLTQQTGENRFFTDHAKRLNGAAMVIALAAFKTIPINDCLSMIQSLNKESGK